MANQSINEFKAKLVGGGARANLFRVTCNFPAFVGGDSELTSFMTKGAQLPSSVINPLMVPFRGRQLQLAGDRTFEPWNITVLNDSAMEVRTYFEKWMNGIAEHTENTGLANPADYMVDLSVEQLDKAGNVTKKYDIRGAWPSNLGAVELSNDSENTIEEFTVEFQMTYWESAGSTD